MYLIFHSLIFSRSPAFWLILTLVSGLMPGLGIWLSSDPTHLLLAFTAALAGGLALWYGLTPSAIPLWWLLLMLATYLGLALMAVADTAHPSLAGTALLCGLIWPWLAYAAWAAMKHEGWC